MSVVVVMMVLFNMDNGLASADAVFHDGGFTEFVMRESQLGQLLLQMLQGQAGVHQSPQYHIAAGTRETVKISDLHSRSVPT